MEKVWYNVGRHYTCAGLQPTKGRQSFANRVHPAGSSMSEGHGIIFANRGRAKFAMAYI